MNKQANNSRTRGAALLLFMLFFVLASAALTAAFARSFYSDLISYRLFTSGSQSFYAAESGVEDMAYRFIAGLTVDTSEVVTVGGAAATTTYTFDGASDMYEIVGVGESGRAFKQSQLGLFMGSGASFNFGVQSGNGGFTMTNTSQVLGNVFSNGTITGAGSSLIDGDVISAGPTGRIIGVEASGTGRARTIEDSEIGADAYAYTLDGGIVTGDAYINSRIGGAVVNGSIFPHEPEEDPTTMPITDAEIDELKQNVVDTGTVIASTDPLCSSGTYVMNADATIGNVKVECNLEFRGNNTDITLTGTLWVTGNVIFKSGPNMAIDAAVGQRTVPIIADNPSDRTTSSQMTIENGTSFAGSGDPKSYVLLISQNNAAENGNLTPVAISVGQSAIGDLLVYAAHGKITMANSVSLKEVTGYLITLGNSTVITYESGLVNLLFTSGPGGGYTLNGWQESY